jgi:hypothetical protein
LKNTEDTIDIEERKKMNIYERMSAITYEIMAVAKNLTVGVGNSKYKATGEADVLSAVKPIEYKYGVYSYPISRKIVESSITETITKSDYGEKAGIKVFMRLETQYTFVNVDDPEQYITITTYGDGIDTQDKACGKAMTYSDKYALLKAYKIITGEDPDQYESKKPVEKPEITEEELKLKETIKTCCTISSDKSKLSDEMKAEIKKIREEFEPSGNPNKIKDIETATKLLKKLESAKVKVAKKEEVEKTNESV